MRPNSVKEDQWQQRSAPLDDAAMQQHLRSLAVSLNPDGEIRLKCCSAAAIRAPLHAARSLSSPNASLPAALEWLIDNGRLIEAFTLSLCHPISRRLPAAGHTTRISRIMQTLIRHSDAHITAERLCDGLSAFDEVRALTMDELWAVPAALAAALCSEYLSVSSHAIAAQRDRLAALKWVDEGAPISSALLRRSPAFFECALKQMHEQDMPAKYQELTQWLQARDRQAERIITLEHEKQALYRLIMSNILTTLRMLSQLDWSECFARISHTEIALRADPSGTYARMDTPSRSQIRDRVAYLAKKCGMGEAAVARCALEAAETCDDIRREICWWLYTDSGTQALLKKIGIQPALRPLVPDPKGCKYMTAVLLPTALLFLLCLFWMGLPAFLALPLLWGASAATVHFIIPRLRHPLPLLKLKLTEIPDEYRTLIVIPALLSSSERAEELVDQLEMLGCLEKDKNLSFLLLGDLSEHDAPEREGDEFIIAAAQDAINAVNQRAGREKYHFLHRPRVFQECEGSCMGRERKRGALSDLNRLLLDGENRFVQPSAQALHGRFTFVITLDAGTRMLPGTAHKLIGALAHPLNRPHHTPNGRKGGFALLAPRMEQAADAVENRFIELYGGTGGIDSYPTAVSNVYQDLCGQGMFGGKGIYDIEAFEEALRGRLPDNAILSHDMIEGILARCAFVCDTALYDAHPKTVKSYLMRLGRWTRGDWQLLPLLFSRRIRLQPLDRYKIIDNLRRSLQPLMQMLLLYIGFYAKSPFVVLLGILPQVLELILGLPWTKNAWMRTLLRLSLLPQEAFTQTSALLRALWRMTVSKKHLLQWITADDADRRGGKISPVYGWIASILLLPALIAPAPWLLLDVLLAALWWTAPSLIESMEQPIEEHEPLSPAQRDLLRDIAARTFLFFTEYTSSTGLPPDNVQLDPVNKTEGGIARRTSPTNIGLYLASCVSARELGLISAEKMHARISQTLISLEKMEKWHGQLYNWYHTDTLEPLRPKYVSSVDSGNLAACLLLCARALELEGFAETAQRIEKLLDVMDFTRLFDQKRKLFVIGMDVENDRLSGSHYDLLASESRILSFTAMMLGQIPISHWAHLGRMAAPAGHGEALISWSGTMFEYLMPSLLLPVYRGTLLSQTQNAVVEAQMAHNASSTNAKLPWGVSESGYYAFDLALNYQYRAFGLPELALRGDASAQVIAPYASLLALPSHPQEVMENLQHMIELDMLDTCGLFEAADCAVERLPRNTDMKIIQSHMAHHQGMILCAICNALTDNSLIRFFCDRPQARALTLLLQEKPAARLRLSAHAEKQADTAYRPLPLRTHRFGQPDSTIPDTHLLSGFGVTALLTADGAAFVRRSDFLLNRREVDPHMPPQGLFVHAHDRTHRQHFLLSGTRKLSKNTKLKVQFDAGSALYHTQTDQLDMKLRAFISPEDGAFLQQVSLVNCTDAPIELDITGCFQPALAHEADYAAHPVFQNLFIESARPTEHTLCLRRRPRAFGQRDPILIYQVCGAPEASVSVETDLSRLCGRKRLMSDPGALPDELSNTVGNTLTPCAALRIRITLPPRNTQTLCFSAALIAEESAGAFIERHSTLQSAERAAELSCTQFRELLRFLSLSTGMHHLLQRAAALLLYPRLHAPILPEPPQQDLRRSQLWALGISGDLPIILAHAQKAGELQPIRELIQAHEFYRLMGISCDLVLINDHGNDYEQPVRDRLHDLISGSHLCGAVSTPGGVYLLDAQALSAEMLDLLHMAAAFVIHASSGTLSAQLNAALKAAHPPLPVLDAPLPSSRPLSCPNALAYNGFGGFTPDGYFIDRIPTPAPWCNILCNAQFGSMLTERGGGFIWHENSRNGRITPFDNDPMQEGWGDLLLISIDGNKNYAPAYAASRITHSIGKSVFEGGCTDFSWELTQFVDAEMPVKCHHLKITAHRKVSVRIQARIDFIMNVTRSAASLTARGFDHGILWARGEIGALAFACFGAADLQKQSSLKNGLLTVPLQLMPNEEKSIDLLIGAEKDFCEIQSLLIRWRDGGSAQKHLADTLEAWRQRLSRISITTPHPLLDQMVNRYLPYQTICARIYGRAGFYQAGGAFGFRDQLQDMLCMLLIEPDMVRRHLILCAAHQFESGDVQHWWHPEYTGVRTHISDDLLFLPYVTAEYIQTTGDSIILDASIPFLKDVPIPKGHEDWYGEALPSEKTASLHEHCLRAIRRAYRTGTHGLLLMGSGDWNDGMNRVGHEGIGESIWLTEFMIVVLEKYAPLCNEETQSEFFRLASQLREAIELHGWDGKWYRRAYMDDGTPLGSSQSDGGCRIDSLAQSWAVLAGLSRDRVKTAMSEVEKQLIDRENGIIKLLTPPFDGEIPDPGYIRGYPPGIRENGGQYTHAACWVVIALAELGLGDKAWEAFGMLLPCSHSNTEEKALEYRVEPYVIAADIYGEPPHTGRGGWTWYTGAAGWMVRAAYVHLMGLSIRGKYAVLNALLPLSWDEASVTLRVGQSLYTLTARRSCGSALLDGAPLSPEGVALVDDGLNHQAVFPIRKV